MPSSVEFKIPGERLSVSNVDKILYPTAKFTKGQLIEFYAKIAPCILPHLRRRPRHSICLADFKSFSHLFMRGPIFFLCDTVRSPL